jgi:uncharacterized protein
MARSLRIGGNVGRRATPHAATPDVDRFLALVLRNPVVDRVLAAAEADARQGGLPGWYLTAGCLFQTVWNVLDGHEPGRGIRDYDLFYFDDRDLSWEAEDAVIRRWAGLALDADIGPEVEVRNEARVHLWYEQHFGAPCPPFRSSEDAISQFAATACCVGIRREHGVDSVWAPFGFEDLFAFVLRPNPVQAPRHVYEAKAARWRELWPRLEVLPWPGL